MLYIAELLGKGERQYDDAFLDFSFFEKYKLTEPDLYEALMKAVQMAQLNKDKLCKKLV